MKRNKRVVITGIGPISSLGIGKEETWSNALARENGLIKVAYKVGREILDSYYLHKIPNFNIKKFNIDTLALKAIDGWKKNEEIIELYYFLATIKLALDDSRLVYDHDNNNIALILSAESPGYGHLYSHLLNFSYSFFANHRKKMTKKDYFQLCTTRFNTTAYDLQNFMFLFHVAKTFNIHGFSLQINNACASGLYALEAATDIIQSGKSQAVIISAVEYPDVFKSLWLKNININPKDGKTKPFSYLADGFVMGEGGAAFVIEELGHALKRGAKIYAEYLGGSFSLEAWKVTFPRVNDDFYLRTIKKCLCNCRLRPESIDLIVPHAPATPVVDNYELAALESIFNQCKSSRLMTAFKSYVGHNLGGCTLTELSLLLLCIEKKNVLPMLNINQLKHRASLAYVTEIIQKEINIALKICTAFAGFNAAVAIKKYD